MRKKVVITILAAAVLIAALYVAQANWFGWGEPIPCRRAYLPWMPRVICTETVGNIFGNKWQP